jgi:hypothetical protein
MNHISFEFAVLGNLVAFCAHKRQRVAPHLLTYEIAHGKIEDITGALGT